MDILDKEFLEDSLRSAKAIMIYRSLHDLALRDIKKISKEDNVIASFILCSCFIEQMATFRYGSAQVGKKEFIAFVTEYLPNYDPIKLRHDLRNRLVHNYSIGETYVLTRQHPEVHLRPHGGGVCINIENFVEELENAFLTFYGQIQSDKKIRGFAAKALDVVHTIGGQEMDIKLDS